MTTIILVRTVTNLEHLSNIPYYMKTASLRYQTQHLPLGRLRFACNVTTNIQKYEARLLNGTTILQQQYQVRRYTGSSIAVKAPPLRKRDDEEYHASRALRFMQQKQPNIILHVENVQLSAMKLLPRVAEMVMQSTPIRIKVLTHVDTISDEALRQQIHTVQQLDDKTRLPNQVPIAIIAVNLESAADSMKARELSEVRDIIFGASQLVTKPEMLVCGIPNSGKSSLIYPLTRHRTINEKKKGAYHLPKVSSKAGMTLGVKRHLLDPAFGSFIKYNVALIDMPGFRPRLLHADPNLVALLLSAGVTEPFKDYKIVAPHSKLLDILLQAVNRHTAMTDPDSVPPYVELLNLDRPIEDPDLFLKAYMEWAKVTPKAKQIIPGHSDYYENIYWPRTFLSGVFGGLIFTPYPTIPHSSQSNHITIDRDLPVVYMNEQAQRLMNIGQGKVKPTKIEERKPLTESRSLNDRNNVPLDPNRELHPVVYPPHQRTFKCMQCAQFVKLDAGNKVYGRRHGRAVDWSYHDMLSYFSRMSEVFGGMWSKRTAYLFKDSLACTLAIKHKLRSRAAAYKKFNHLKDYPVPNDLRPKRFQIDQPIPYIHFCTRKIGSCRTMTDEEIARETERLEKYNVTDHTFQIMRKRGYRIRRKHTKPDGEEQDIPQRKRPIFQMSQCIVQRVGPLSAIPRYDENGNERFVKRHKRKKDIDS